MPVPPPPLPPAPRRAPGGLSVAQKTAIVFSAVATIALVCLGAVFVLWTRVKSDPASELEAVAQAKARYENRRRDYEAKLQSLPAGTLPADWNCEDILSTFEEDWFGISYELCSPMIVNDDGLSAGDLANLTSWYVAGTPEIDPNRVLDPLRHTPAAIEQNLLGMLRGQPELQSLITAIRQDIYYVEYDLFSEYDYEVPYAHTAATLLAGLAWLEARHGAPEASIAGYVDVLRFAEMTGAAPFLSNQSDRRAIERTAEPVLWELCDRTMLTDGHRSTIERAFDRLRNTDRIKELIAEDFGMSLVRELGAAERNNPFVRAMLSAADIHDAEALKSAADSLSALIDKPYGEMKAAVDEFASSGNEFVESLASETAVAREQQLRSLQYADAFRLALALKKFKGDSGAYPESIEALVPNYIDALPVDPFSDEPMNYLRWNEGFLLVQSGQPYSQDENGDYYAYEDNTGLLWRARN